MRRAVTGSIVGVLALAGAGAALLSAPAGAVGVSGGGVQAFGASPAALPDGQQRSYYDLTLSPGQSTTDSLVVANQSSSEEELSISPSYGVTAPNSGDAYAGMYKPCTNTSCWVTGLPTTVTLGPGANQTVSFSVTVPGGSGVKQYLAGITIQPTNLPPSQNVGSNGRGASARATVVHQINIGVAVTVGAISQLATTITVPTTTVSIVGTTPRLNVQVQNTGQTFFNGPGTASCTGEGKSANFGFTVDTILPGEGATIPVNAPGFAAGAPLSCSVSIGYGAAQTAGWRGALTVPSVTPTTIIRTGPNSYASVPVSKGIPAWAYALFGVGGVLLVLVFVLLVVTVRRRKKPGELDQAVAAAAAAAAAAAVAATQSGRGESPPQQGGVNATQAAPGANGEPPDSGAGEPGNGSGQTPAVPQGVAQWMEHPDETPGDTG